MFYANGLYACVDMFDLYFIINSVLSMFLRNLGRAKKDQPLSTLWKVVQHVTAGGCKHFYVIYMGSQSLV